MDKVLLKISEEMFSEILNGNKNFEVRKLNKDYIQEGDKIMLVSLEERNEMSVVVTKKEYLSPLVIANSPLNYNHEPTRCFVRSNYMEEFVLIVFTFEIITKFKKRPKPPKVDVFKDGIF